MTSIHNHHKDLILKLSKAMYNLDASSLKSQLSATFAADAHIHLAHPFEDIAGPAALYQEVYQPLLKAIPDLERRDFIVMAGETDGHTWVGCGGHYLGRLVNPWLAIPPTGQLVAMRFHEFYRFENDKIVEMQALWDIPQIMMQAQAWPLAPSLGVEMLVPGPAQSDGIVTAAYDHAQAESSLSLVRQMLTDMGKHPLEGDVDIMNLERYWHPKMNWYGPAGIGSMRGIKGFRKWHQIPFLKAMPDRKGAVNDAAAMFGDHNYVGTTGWPNMQMHLSGDGWLGIAPANKKITMRSLDFWRCQDGLIRENWVLVDLLHVYHQLGVDVFSRMKEISHARQE